MTTRMMGQNAVLWLLLSAAAFADARPGLESDKPTRQEIIAYALECKQRDVQMDLVERFGSDFSGLDLSGVDLRGARAHAREEHRPDMETTLRGANFTNSNLQGVNLEGANLAGADFAGADLSYGNFEFANLRDATLQNVNVTGTRFFYSRCAGATMAGLDLSQSNITAASFPDADLSGSTLAGTTFHFTWQVNFRGADLSDADLHGLTLSHSDFQDANLRAANLSGCDLRHSDFSRADLHGVNFTNALVGAAVFDGAQGLSDAEMRRLTRAAWRFVLQSRVAAFLDSIAFPAGLLLAIPLVAVATRAVRLRRARPMADIPAKFQFNLSTMLLLTALIGSFLGVAMLSLTGAYSYAMVCAFYMMVAEVTRRRTGLRFALVLLATALIYTASNIVLHVTVDPILRLDDTFGIGVVLVGPLLAIIGSVVAAIIFWRAKKCFPLLGLAGFGIWMVGVGCGNLWLIASAMASV